MKHGDENQPLFLVIHVPCAFSVSVNSYPRVNCSIPTVHLAPKYFKDLTTAHNKRLLSILSLLVNM